MLGNYNAGATLAVRDLEKATGFYGGVLGLHLDKEDPYQMVYSSGDTRLEIYVSNFAGSNKSTAAHWIVDDVDAEVAGLKQRGVKFEHYDLPGVTVEGDIHIMGEDRAAWFKDPDGNILCVHTA